MEVLKHDDDDDDGVDDGDIKREMREATTPSSFNRRSYPSSRVSASSDITYYRLFEKMQLFPLIKLC